MNAKVFNWRIAVLAWVIVLCFDAVIMGIDKLDTAALHRVFPIFLLWVVINAPGVNLLAFAATVFWGHGVSTVHFGTPFWIIGCSVVSATFWGTALGFASALLTRHTQRTPR